MSGRGRAGGGGSTTVRAVATALGIARHEMAAFAPKQVVEPPPLYPVVKRMVLPVDNSDDMQYMHDLKLEVQERFPNSQFYLDTDEKKDIRRYVDKYNKLDREKFRPEFSRLPEELCWQKEKRAEVKAKRKRLDESGEEKLQEKLKKLEEKEKKAGGGADAADKDDDEGSETDKSELAEPEAISEDEGEEDNDYISNYFDNGEGYGDAGSDDNMDGEEY